MVESTDQIRSHEFTDLTHFVVASCYTSEFDFAYDLSYDSFQHGQNGKL